jgi:hypothetical protein
MSWTSLKWAIAVRQLMHWFPLDDPVMLVEVRPIYWNRKRRSASRPAKVGPVVSVASFHPLSSYLASPIIEALVTSYQ